MQFISGQKFKEISNFVLDEQGFYVNNPNITINKPIFFIKTDYIQIFFKNFLPKENFILITHNSDLPVDQSYEKFLQTDNMIAWFGQNVNYKHKKLIPIPIGIANPCWIHGNINAFNDIISKNYHKDNLYYANFNTSTNSKVRNECLKNIDQNRFETNIDFSAYLEKVSRSYFTICPQGNGIDSHRIWESLYLKTIPIAENTYNIRYLKQKYNLPILLIDNWHNFNQLELSEKLYFQTLGLFSPSSLNTEKFIYEI